MHFQAPPVMCWSWLSLEINLCKCIFAVFVKSEIAYLSVSVNSTNDDSVFNIH